MAQKGTPQDLEQLVNAAFDRVLALSDKRFHPKALETHGGPEGLRQHIDTIHASLYRAAAQRPRLDRQLH